MTEAPDGPRPEAPLRVGLYIRFSTDEQRKKSFSAETQADECLTRFRQVHGETPYVLRRFEDLGLSGALGIQDPADPGQPYRPGLTELLRVVAARELDLVLCFRQDRLTRDEYLWHYMRAMVFEKTGTPVLFAQESHDILTPEGRMIATIQALQAEQERRKISANVAASCRRRAAEGYKTGTPPYGWQYEPGVVPQPRQRRRIVRDEAEGAILLQIRDRYLSGWPTVEICRDLHRRGIAAPGGGATWSTDGLLKVLRNPVHAGLVAHRETLHPGAHAQQRYWSPEDREYLLQRISGRADRVVHARTVQDYPLSGVLYCEHCGRRLVGNMDTRKHRRHYSCHSPRTEGEHHSHLRGRQGQLRSCPGVHLGAVEVEQAIRQAVSELARSTAVQSAAREKLETALDAADERIAAELAGVEKDLSEVAGGFSRLFGLLDAGLITQAEFAAENEKRRAQEETLTARRAELAGQLQQRRGRQAELDRAVAILRDIDALWDHMTPGERRQLLLEIDPRISARRDKKFNVVTLRPGFAEPIELSFVRAPRNPVAHRGPDAELTRVQLAVLALWAEGKTIPQIARQRDVAVGTVRWTLECIRERLQVETLEEAYELQKETLARCRHTLVLEGRAKKRACHDPQVLTPALLEVLKLMAKGLGGTAIAKALGKDKSTISRQVAQVRSRLGVSTMAEAVARGRELGLVE